MLMHRLWLAAAVVPALSLAALNAQQIDMQAMARWSNAKVVRYHISGVYQARTVIAHKEAGGQGDVTDKVTVDLDWNLRENKIVGRPTFQNAKSEVKNLRNVETSCPPPTPKGEYEHISVTAVQSSEGQRVELKGATSFPLMDVTANCQGSWVKRTVAATQEPSNVFLPIPAPMMLVLPAGSSGNVRVSPDKKSFVLNAGDWTWTYTPSVVQ